MSLNENKGIVVNTKEQSERVALLCHLDISTISVEVIQYKALLALRD